MKIAIIGTRGIPNNYGGFEQFAEYLSVGLVERGHDVTVYSPHFHSFKEPLYKGVRIKHIYSPECWMGNSIGSFFYDYACLRDALKKQTFDIVYELGYTSIVPSYIWFDVRKITSPVIITNMDGLEYLRPKFNKWVRRFLRWEEKMAIRYSPYLVTDNQAIHDYHLHKYGRESKMLAYGADVRNGYNEAYLQEFDLMPENYLLVIARMEPENNIEMIINGYLESDMKNKPLIIVGKLKTSHGKYLVERYGAERGIRFMNGIYDVEKLNSLRHFSYAYFHGHSVGGTNPSLLEAMAAGCFIFAHENAFNRSVLNGKAIYFNDKEDITTLLNHMPTHCLESKEDFVSHNLYSAEKDYGWAKLIADYEAYFGGLLSKEHL